MPETFGQHENGCEYEYDQRHAAGGEDRRKASNPEVSVAVVEKGHGLIRQERKAYGK
jgi:hypothetical protein